VGAQFERGHFSVVLLLSIGLEAGFMTDIMIGSPSKLEEILHFDPGPVKLLSVPDSVTSLAVGRVRGGAE
jgi:hypothetical protein